MVLNHLGRLLWAIGLGGHLALLFVLIDRDRARRFPAFTALIGTNVVRTLLLFVMQRAGWERTYMLTYMGTDGVDVFLQFAVVYEVASHVFRPLGHWALDIRRGMQILIGGSLVVALGLTWLGAPVAEDWRVTVLVGANFFSSTLMSELFVGMLFLSVTVGLPWRTHVARIAHGLGAYSIVDVAIDAGHTLYSPGYGPQVHEALTNARMLVYLSCLGYWIVTLWQTAPQPRELPPALRQTLRALEAQLADNLGTLRSWRKP